MGLEKLTVPQLVKKYPYFMESEGSSPYSKQPVICLFPKP